MFNGILWVLCIGSVKLHVLVFDEAFKPKASGRGVGPLWFLYHPRLLWTLIAAAVCPSRLRLYEPASPSSKASNQMLLWNKP